MATRLGAEIRRSRVEAGWTQRELASVAGISSSMLSRIELGSGGSVSMTAWASVAGALALDMALHAAAPAACPVGPGATARTCHRLVLDLAGGAGWSVWVDIARNETILVRRDRCQAIVILVWDVVASLSSMVAAFDRRLTEERRDRGAAWTVGGVAIVASTGHNRRRLTEGESLVNEAFPARGAEWLIALRGGPLPRQPGLVWTDERLKRLRPMIPYLDRRRRNRCATRRAPLRRSGKMGG